MLFAQVAVSVAAVSLHCHAAVCWGDVVGVVCAREVPLRRVKFSSLMLPSFGKGCVASTAALADSPCESALCFHQICAEDQAASRGNPNTGIASQLVLNHRNAGQCGIGFADVVLPKVKNSDVLLTIPDQRHIEAGAAHCVPRCSCRSKRELGWQLSGHFLKDTKEDRS